MTPIPLKTEEIRIDGGTQTRVGTNNDVVTEYKAAIEEGATFPPVVVFHDGEAYWLADGFHRFQAHSDLEMKDILTEVRQGTRRDAVLFSVGANASHGLQRSPADKRRAVEALLADEEWVVWTDREIARRTNTSAPFVGKVRAEVTVNDYSDERTYTTRHGGTATMQTAKIKEAARRRKTKAAAPETLHLNASDGTITRSRPVALVEDSLPREPELKDPAAQEAVDEFFNGLLPSLQEAHPDWDADECEAVCDALRKRLRRVLSGYQILPRKRTKQIIQNGRRHR